jgi:hypothetical protein
MKKISKKLIYQGHINFVRIQVAEEKTTVTLCQFYAVFFKTKLILAFEVCLFLLAFYLNQALGIKQSN